MTARTYPLGVARAVAVRTLTELGTQRPGWRPNPDYWMELLAEALRQMVDATAPDRVIDVAPLPEHAAEVAEDIEPERLAADYRKQCGERQMKPWGYLCSRTKGHSGNHIAHGSDDDVCAAWPQEPPGHLAQSAGGLPGCTYPDCRIHQPAPAREVGTAVLAAHPLDGAR